MPGLRPSKARRLLGVIASCGVTLVTARSLQAQAPAPGAESDAAGPGEPSSEPPTSPETPGSPSAPTRAHDPSVTSGAGTPPPARPITVRPGVEAPGAPDVSAVELGAGLPALLPSWSERRVAVVLVPARRGISLRIRPLGAPADEERCSGGCVASVRPGRYEISVFDAGSDTGSRELELTRPERLLLTPPNETARSAGLVLGVAGSVLFGAGVVMSAIAYSNSLSECGDEACDGPPAWLGPVGIGAGVVGGIAMPIGWVLFGNNLGPRVERTPLDPVTFQSVAKSALLSARVERARGGSVELGGSFSF